MLIWAFVCLDLFSNGTLVCSAATPAQVAAQDRRLEHFERRIRPLLIERCYECHRAQLEEPAGRLSLDTPAGWMQGGDSGPAIVPGKPEQSLLLRAVRHELADLQMPPDGRLTGEEIKAIEQWIRDGAVDPRTEGAPGGDPSKARASTRASEAARRGESLKHWAFQPRTLIRVPERAAGFAAANEIDRFLAKQWEVQGLRPVPLADRATWLRRVTLDVTGLPPRREEIERFLSNDSPDAYEQVVERLLASPAYGERWGRFWLDVVRYADSNGLDENIAHGNAWRYRDYVIQAFNDDLPFDQFIQEQLAGDLLNSAESAEGRSTRWQQRIIATGMLSLGPKVLAEVDEQKMEMDIVDEQVDTVGRALMGLTLGCARCHDHKFDPFSTREYYAFAGIFKNTRTMEHFKKIARWQERSLESPEQTRHREALEAEIAELEAAIKRLETADGKEASRSNRSDQATVARAELLKLKDSLNQLRKVLPEHPTAMAVSDYEQPQDLRLHVRGSHLLQTGEPIPRGFPQWLFDSQDRFTLKAGSGRLELARWLTAPEHPLTARVLVNRVWRWHFGRGLVESTDNFGTQGTPPTHPQLLDYLANYLIANQWSLKQLHRLILGSAAYRLVSDTDPHNQHLDPENRWHWRHPVRRLEAEAIRDTLLSVSEQLDRRGGGPTLQVNNREFLFNHTSQDGTSYDSRRRSVYLPVIRNHLYDVFQLFDYANASVLSGNRPSTIVPSQALYLLNGPLTRHTAHELVKRTASERDSRARLVAVYERLFGRMPHESEVQGCLRFLQSVERRGATPSDRPANQLPVSRLEESAPTHPTESPQSVPSDDAWFYLCQTLLCSQELIYVR